MQRSLPALSLVFFFAACQNSTQTGNSTDSTSPAVHHAPPSWILNGNIYEVNVRQYTPEGTFKAFAASLQRLKDMGVQTLWFMPINPISKQDRKGELGSYYAVSDYTAVNPEYGTLQDFKDIVSRAHGMGFKVIIDWVPNHTGADHPWTVKHPDFYVHDSTGKLATPYDWTDTRKLDYANTVMGDSMIAAMKFWLTETGIDGFRCDVAGDVPEKFWKRCIPELKKVKNVFMLGEAEKPWMYDAGFDANYGWEYFAMSKQVAAGKRPAYALDSVLNRYDTANPAGYLKLFFTSNHDENSWNKADYATMPGASHAPFAVLTQTLPHGIPLIYTGQEEPWLDSISFFYKHPIKFGKFARAGFYRTLLTLHGTLASLNPDASFRKVNIGDSTAVYSFVREKSGDRVLVIANLSAREQKLVISGKALQGRAENEFDGKQVDSLSQKPFMIEPWGYIVYHYVK